MPRIFISYRRDDSRTITGRIYDRLSSEFGKENVFRDLDGIALGSDFRRVIEREVASCDFLLAIIGSRWVTIADSQGRKRIDDPSDFVRIEVETALRLPNVTVIPVYVDGVRGILAADLPPTLADLPYRNAAYVRDDPDFHGDVDKLVGAIKNLVPVAAPVFVPPPPTMRLDPKFLIGLLALIVVIAAIATVANNLRQSADPTLTPTTQAAIAPTSTNTVLPPTETDTPIPPTVTDTPVPILTLVLETPTMTVTLTDDSATKDAVIYQMATSAKEQVSALAAVNNTTTSTSSPQLISTVLILPNRQTATESLLQRTADAKSATNEAFFAESTHIAETATIFPSELTCEGHIVDTNNGLTTIRKVYDQPSTDGTLLSPVRAGQKVIITEKRGDNDQNSWFKIEDENKQYLGWIHITYIVLGDPSCSVG